MTDVLRPRAPARPSAQPAARSLLLTVLGEWVLDLDAPVWTVALLRGLTALGVREKAARQAIARSAADGWLERDRVGRQVRWRLSDATRGLLRRGAERIYSFGGVTTGWDRRWLVVMVSVPEERRDDRHRLRTRLAWAGFGSLGQGAWITPHLDREREARDVLAALAPPVEATSFVAHHGRIGDERTLVAGAWGGLEALERHYRDFVATFAGADPSSQEEAFVAQTRMVHEWRTFPFLDPGLPEEFLPPGWKGLEARALFQRRHREWAGAARAWFRAGNPERPP
ncbi:PaaX family transcriptional regulator C-terminal domain-containing protein [soil metagenome]